MAMEIINDFDKYDIETYKKDITKRGLKETWTNIVNTLYSSKMSNSLFALDNFGALYELGLAHIDKESKKEMGKYFTPIDVSELMANWLIDLDGENICDVCCGTGNLILAYLQKIGEKKAKQLLKDKKIYLYDIDEIALMICKYSIAIKYGKEYLENINCISGDFLDKTIQLPINCKVIANPPYFKINEISSTWNTTENIKNSKELYSAIMEKIILNSKSSVIITPYSFLGGNKFYPLRKELNNFNGYIVSFDNVPGNIFNGKKYGIFNSNTSNSVRASITVTENQGEDKGYRISPLIRFKNEERNRLLKSDVLLGLLPKERQIVTEDDKAYYKCFGELETLYKAYKEKSNKTLKDYLVNCSDYSICVPNSCRYFTVGTLKDLKRTGKHTLYFESKEDRDLIYGVLNSSFCYWYWRLYDGGITYPLGLLKSLPIFVDNLTKMEKEKFLRVVETMQSKESTYFVYKKNASEMQESVKFPIEYRSELNSILMGNLGTKKYNLNIIHSNTYFNTTKEEDLDE